MRGRRITKPKEQRIRDLIAAVNRSGFTPSEAVGLIADWCNWKSVEIVDSVDQKVRVPRGGMEPCKF